ncbi:hypothetical protein BU26DRAFT_524245 [Trematosphaeria pertusa]|uniref:DUF3074 domain-containing protein n=1 Tax=Trematosphaeria pertusa TaxID=390896 RepID=A0A6A6HXB5_9PLEO|nr:uncharacterized protein BU26DRAFT_524245 [Trematosphaeria pertusa]KAF2242677.1 hypothetical protein BU26DRAFT_524245 [Trematosphaeria pertusa]
MPASWLLSDRFFTVLVISGARRDLVHSTTHFAEAMDMQIPIDLSTFPAAIKARSHAQLHANKLVYEPPVANPTPFQKSRKGRKLVEGVYVSLEKVAQLKQGDNVINKWEMKTASDARGGLPKWMQNMGVPGAIAKDVGLAGKFILEATEEGVSGPTLVPYEALRICLDMELDIRVGWSRGSGGGGFEQGRG